MTLQYVNNEGFIGELYPNKLLGLYLICTICGYSLFYLILGYVGVIEFPSEDVLVIQCVSLFAFWIFYGIGIKLHHISSLLLLIFIYQFIFSAFLFYSQAFEPNPDYYTYSAWAWEPIQYHYHNYVEYISRETRDISDWGYPIFLNMVYNLAGGKHDGDLLMCICNIFINVFTLIFLWKLVCRMFNAKIAKLTVLLWGLNVYNIWFNVTGLKEVIFTFFMMGAFYFLYNVSNTNRLKDSCWLFVFVLMTVFFRYYVTIFFILIYIASVFFRRLYENYFTILILLAFIFIIIGVDILAYFIPEAALVYEDQIRVWGSNGVLFSLMNVYSAFTAPYPAFTSSNQNVNLLTLLFSILKVSLSFWGIYGIYLLIKNKQTKIYPLINILLLNIFLTIISGFSLNYRYMHITMPLYFIFIIYGFAENKHKLMVSLLSWGTGGVLTLLYNLK